MDTVGISKSASCEKQEQDEEFNFHSKYQAIPSPTGLRIESLTQSIEELTDQSALWGLEREQLVPGRYEGRISAGHSGNVQLARSFEALGTLLRGHAPHVPITLRT